VFVYVHVLKGCLALRLDFQFAEPRLRESTSNLLCCNVAVGISGLRGHLSNGAWDIDRIGYVAHIPHFAPQARALSHPKANHKARLAQGYMDKITSTPKTKAILES
jgi:hypothetical protein